MKRLAALTLLLVIGCSAQESGDLLFAYYLKNEQVVVRESGGVLIQARVSDTGKYNRADILVVNSAVPPASTLQRVTESASDPAKTLTVNVVHKTEPAPAPTPAAVPSMPEQSRIHGETISSQGTSISAPSTSNGYSVSGGSDLCAAAPRGCGKSSTPTRAVSSPQ